MPCHASDIQISATFCCRLVCGRWAKFLCIDGDDDNMGDFCCNGCNKPIRLQAASIGQRGQEQGGGAWAGSRL